MLACMELFRQRVQQSLGDAVHNVLRHQVMLEGGFQFFYVFHDFALWDRVK
jgi:hypothetical protein